MDEDRIVDGIFIENPKNPRESVVFNFYTWASLLKAIMVKYGSKSEEDAEHALLSSSLIEHALDGYMTTVGLAHELTYHWAMLLAHGEDYWLKGISPTSPEGYWEWSRQFRMDHGLADENFVFND